MSRALRVSLCLAFLACASSAVFAQQPNPLWERTAYKLAIALKADYAEAHYNLAMLYFRLGDRNQAEHHYNILKTINPDVAEALLKKLVQ